MRLTHDSLNPRSLRRGIVATVGIFVLAAGCDTKLSGPSPTLTSTSPRVLCVGLDASISIQGTGLSVVPLRLLGEKPTLGLPRVTVRRVEDLDAMPTADMPLVIKDDPNHPELSQLQLVSD